MIAIDESINKLLFYISYEKNEDDLCRLLNWDKGKLLAKIEFIKKNKYIDDDDKLTKKGQLIVELYIKGMMDV